MTSPYAQPISDYQFRLPPKKHQLREFLRSRDMKEWALLFEMGCGKSKVLIDTGAYLFGRGKINGMVVVLPSSVCRSWHNPNSKDEPGQLSVHLPEGILQNAVLHLWEGAHSAREKKALQRLLEVDPLSFHVLIMSIEAATATKTGLDMIKKFLRGHTALLAIDEATIIKHITSKRTKTMIDLGGHAAYRRILTGTIEGDRPLDMFAPFQFLKPGCLGVDSFFAFKARYAVLKEFHVSTHTFKQVVGYQRLDELHEKIMRLSSYVRKADCLDLPEKIYLKRHIKVTPEQARVYKELKDDAISWLKNGDLVTADLVLTRLMRMRQVLCGFVTAMGDEGNVKSDLVDPDKNPKFLETLSVIEEAGSGKVIVWATMRRTIEQLVEFLRKELGHEAVAPFYGGMSDKERWDSVDKFQNPDSKLKVMVMQPRSGGYGITLTAANTVVYLDNEWSLEIRKQSEDRAHRIGQTKAVTYVDLVVEDTVDERVLSLLVKKQELADQILLGSPEQQKGNLLTLFS